MLLDKHGVFERHSLVLLIGILIAVSIGGLVELVPNFYLKSTTERVEGMRPYTPLELAGRNIYVREGCYTCHSQMIRTLRDEVERYGHYSLAAESMYDRPFQWGSKRTGPDLARVGGKYSDEWQVQHLIDPRSVSPASIMPGYPFLATTELDYEDIALDLRINQIYGVPYSDEMLELALQDVRTQADPLGDGADPDGLEARYPTVNMRDFDGDPERVTEMDALVAYLQMLGTLVDFSTFDNQAEINLR
ncbi:MAG: cytochrome-c oxidase, cbb3-type subunit II [Pseudomonadota bacterium]